MLVMGWEKFIWTFCFCNLFHNIFQKISVIKKNWWGSSRWRIELKKIFDCIISIHLTGTNDCLYIVVVHTPKGFELFILFRATEMIWVILVSYPEIGNTDFRYALYTFKQQLTLRFVHTAMATTIFYVFRCHHSMNTTISFHETYFFPLLFPSQLGAVPISWRHQNNENYVVAVKVWTDL